jgi:hypothetical protein
MDNQQIVMVPVPVSRLDEVYEVLGSQARVTFTTPAGEQDEEDVWDSDMADRLLAGALPTERRLLQHLASNGGEGIPGRELAVAIGGNPDEDNFIPGVIGPLTRRCKALNLPGLPFTSSRDSAGETSYLMPIDVALVFNNGEATSKQDFTSGGDGASFVRLHMDELASEMGWRVEQTPASRKYRPQGRAGAWLQPRQGNLYFDMRPFAAAGDSKTAAELIQRMERLAGRPTTSDMANIPLNVLAQHWESAKAEIIVPYFEARGRHLG